MSRSALNPRTQVIIIIPNRQMRRLRLQEAHGRPGFHGGLRPEPDHTPPLWPQPCLSLHLPTLALSHSFPASYFSLISQLFDNHSQPFMN